MVDLDCKSSPEQASKNVHTTLVKKTIFSSLLLIAGFAFAQQQSPTTAPEHAPNLFAEPQTFPLWEHNVPGAKGSAE